MVIETYYAVYLSCCAIVIALLGFILHRSDAIFLNNAFAGNHTLARAVGNLLDVGFYLLSLGYVALTYHSFWRQIDSYSGAIQSAIGKLGGFMIVLGVMHFFNLLLLALFRHRSPRQYSQGA